MHIFVDIPSHARTHARPRRFLVDELSIDGAFGPIRIGNSMAVLLYRLLSVAFKDRHRDDLGISIDVILQYQLPLAVSCH